MSRIGDFADDDVSGWIALSPELGKAMAAFSGAVYNRNRLPMRVREIARIVILRQVVGDPTIVAGLTGAIAIATSRAFVERDPEAVDRIHTAGLGVLLYTLNDEDAWSQAVALGVDGIITDRAIQLDEWLGENAGGVASRG